MKIAIKNNLVEKLENTGIYLLNSVGKLRKRKDKDKIIESLSAEDLADLYIKEYVDNVVVDTSVGLTVGVPVSILSYSMGNSLWESAVFGTGAAYCAMFLSNFVFGVFMSYGMHKIYNYRMEKAHKEIELSKSEFHKAGEEFEKVSKCPKPKSPEEFLAHMERLQAAGKKFNEDNKKIQQKYPEYPPEYFSRRTDQYNLCDIVRSLFEKD
jgi:hypothetical protein